MIGLDIVVHTPHSQRFILLKKIRSMGLKRRSFLFTDPVHYWLAILKQDLFPYN